MKIRSSMWLAGVFTFLWLGSACFAQEKQKIVPVAEQARVFITDIHVSLSSRRNVVLLRRAPESAHHLLSNHPAHTCASRRWFLRSQNRTSIRCLGPSRAVTED
jgi:hypothetical protein